MFKLFLGKRALGKTLIIGLFTLSVVFAQIQLGTDIDGAAANDYFGYSVSLSSDGKRVAVGAYGNEDSGVRAGHVGIYSESGGIWALVGSKINGEAAADQSGWSVSLSSDGSRVAIGAPYNDEGGNTSGHVRVFSESGGIWTQVGIDINGGAVNDNSGWSVSLSSDGSRVAVGEPYNDAGGSDRGRVRIYAESEGEWSQVGSDINGVNDNSNSGWSVSLSSDGSRIAIGAPYNELWGEPMGHVRIYAESGGVWSQVGSDIDGKIASEESGWAVSLSSDGRRVAIGARYNAGGGSYRGQSRVYSESGGVWSQVGSDIDGEADDDYSGWSVSLSPDGRRIAIGAPYNDGVSSSSIGHVRIYSEFGGVWTQIGSEIDGEAIGDKSGWSVSLSSDGSRVAIGAPYNNGANGSDSGHARIIVLPIPEINLKQGETAIADGGSYDYGSQAAGSDTDVVFTIENTGTSDLILTTPLTLTGTNADKFSIQTQPESPVSASDSTTFTVRFSPTLVGSKTATIAIANNDSNENPYNLTFNGTGTVGALNYIKVEDAAGSTGSKVTTYAMTSDQTYVVYAAGYDLYGNYIGDQSVTWIGSGVCSSNLSPTSSTSTTFTAVTPGTGTITADHASVTNDTTGTITVGVGAAASFIVTTEHSGTETAGTSFSITLTALDSDGNTATELTGDHTIAWTWTATNSPGGITPTKPTDGNQTFFAGGATISGFTLTNSGGIPTITAVAGSVNGTSAAITVNDAALNYVKVEDTANGAGSEVTTYVMTADQTYIVYAAGYDLYGNFISNQTVSWIGSGVCSSNLSPTSGTSSTFTAVTPGTGTITADHDTAADDTTGIITVGVGAAAAFVVTSEHLSTETSGTSFSVTLTALDSDGNTATGYTGAHSINWTWNATNSPNTTVPTKPTNGNQTFTAGVATISGFTLTNSGETPTITAAAGGVNGTSGAITVIDAALNYIKVEDAAGGAGSEVATYGITADQTYTVYAAGYDEYGNYISDQTVSWTGSGVCSSNLNPSTSASTTFTAAAAGTGTITADHASVIDDTTGTITVGVGAAASFVVTTEHSGTETAGTSFSVTLTALDSDGNMATGYTGDHSINWTWNATNSPGSIAPTKPSDGNQTFSEGTATISGFTLTNSGETPTITAAAGGVNGTSAAITVNDAALNYVKVEDSAGGAGSEVTTYAMTADQTYTVYAAGYDLYGNYINDQTVSWIGSGVCSSNLSPTSSTSTTFTAVTTGTGTITADHDTAADDTTGIITVGVGAAASFIVTTEHLSTETAGTAFSITLTALDSDGNTATEHTGAHSINWTWTATNSPGSIAPTKPSDGNQTFTAGVAAISEFTLVNSGETPTVSAAAGNITGTCAAITVNDADLSYIKVEDAADCAGSEMINHSLTADQTCTVFAAGYDEYGNYISDQSVSWTGSGVCSSNLNPSTGNSTTFTATAAGTGTITADHASVTDDTTGTITVGVGAAASFVVTTEHSGTETAGTSFSVTLTALDSDGNMATGYTGDHSINWTWNATNSPGSVAPTKLSDGNQTFTAGVAAISEFTLTNSGETPTITATTGGVNGSSGTITLNDSALNYVKVEDAADGAGSEVTTYAMTADQTYIVYAAGYDLYGNYIGDQSVTWIGSGVCSSNLSPTSGTSTTFTAVTPGTGTITADHASVIDDTTGTITVAVGTAAAFVVTTEHSGTETAGTAFSITLTALDSDDNTATGYTGAHSINWTWTATNSPGSIAPTKPSDGNQTFTEGVATISGFTLTNSDETPTITATSGSINGTSAALTVNATTPTVTTTAISSITAPTASSGGNVTSDGGVSVTARGVCWSSSTNPTTADSKTTDSTGTGSFTSSITGLSPETTYYVRAYATNSVGASYGSEKTFTTIASPIISGIITIDGSADEEMVLSGLNGVVMSGLPDNPQNDKEGHYTASVDYGWSGTATPTKTGYTFNPSSTTYANVTSDKTAEDYTAKLNTYTLSIQISPSDNGSVTKNPDKSSYDHGETVELTASANTGYSFSVWTGDVPSDHENDNPLTIIMDSDKSITANFVISIPPGISLSTNALCFGATITGIKTLDQQFRILNTGGGTLSWTVTDNASWLECTSSASTENGYAYTSGAGNAVIDVSVDPSLLSEGKYQAKIDITSANASNSPQNITVNLNVYNSGNESPPLGAFDTPVGGSIVSGSVAVTGWALDDIEVKHVEIKRDPDPDDNPAAIGSDGLIHIGYAFLVKDSRTDVEALYPDYPLNDSAGWGYMMLTFGLPRRGNGNFKLCAFAEDLNGKRTLLGTKDIVADNANRIKPYGTIDTPGPGQIISGAAYVNFGWALTPPPSWIPYDGSTLYWAIDSVIKGNVDYGDNRTDIAGSFPECLNANTAGGHKYIDTTQYANGVHMIGWVAYDSDGVGDGMGSRFFEIQNVGATPANIAGIENLKYMEDMSGRLRIDIEGPKEIEVEELGYIKLELKAEGGKRFIGWGVDKTKNLPIGSTLDQENGIFYWMPGPGFLNQHVLHFAVTDGFYVSQPVEVIVNIVPKRYEIHREQENRKIKRLSLFNSVIQFLLLACMYI